MRTFFLLFTILAATAAAQETLMRKVADTRTDTHVEITALFSEAPMIGYAPVRVKVANNLTTGRKIHLRSIASTSYSGNITCESAYAIEVPAGKIVTRDLLLPVSPPHDIPSHGHNMKIFLTGDMGTAKSSLQTVSSPRGVLMSEILHSPNASALDAALSGSTRTSYSNERFAARFMPGMLPSEWLAYSGFDVIVLTQDDWITIPPGPRSAIISWLRQGGHLIFADDTFDRNLPGLPKNTGLGKIDHFPTPTPTFPDPKKFVTWINSRVTTPLAQSVVSDYLKHWPLANEFGEKKFNQLLFFIVALVFGILVGPVNLFVFAKSGKRHRLFFTTPLISLGASLIMIALIIFQDGFGGKGIRIALMEIQQSNDAHTAHIHQEQISRSGLLLSPSFQVDPICLMTPVVMAKTRWTRFSDGYNTSGTFDLQPESGKFHASGSWWQSRSEQGHYLSAVVPTRGRIEPGKEPHTWISTFAFPLQTIYFRNEAGLWTKAENVKTGIPFRATSIPTAEADRFVANQANAFTTRNADYVRNAAQRNNSFVAITNAAPAIDTLKSIRWKNTTTTITGILE